ncbi:MAG: 4-hydroxybenzoate octaprenyltransferase [Gammaproteobacteria bacterium]|nr:MAG: 4-hydroxybenzoate octaprenyltransferase [Gammaproteobacteria bacterium]
MKEKIIACLQLMRADRPVGTVLLACPMLWALWLAAEGKPPANIVLIFLLGAFVMRSAGCVINDFADRDIDHSVERTQSRPLTSGRISAKETLLLFVGLIVCALCLLAFLPASAILPACAAFGLSCVYPFTKRFFKIPQLVLGMAFSTAVLMAYLTIEQQLSARAWVLFVAVVLWTVVYDTYYAMVDRDDDVHLGIHSSALWFGRYDTQINAGLMLAFVLLMIAVGVMNALNGYYYLGLLLACGCLLYQFAITRGRARTACFSAFLNNQWVGVLIFLGIVLSYL